MATIKDVAQAAQVSAAAVSRVLNKDDNISVTPEVRARIFQAAHALGYVSPRQRKAAEHKTHLVIGVADWRIIRPDRPNVRLSSLSCLVQMMTDQYEVSFVGTLGSPRKWTASLPWVCSARKRSTFSALCPCYRFRELQSAQL